MKLVILTAIGIGTATIVGSGIGFLFERATHRFADVIFYIASVIMLIAAIFGLILPAYEHDESAILLSMWVIFGITCLFLTDKLLPIIQKRSERLKSGRAATRALLLILAIGIHNFPEGIAAGVGFGSGDNGMALFIAGGIALQNIPEGMIVISPMLQSGMSHKKAMLISFMTGCMEVMGTVIGYFAVSISSVILPFVLAFAGGTMLYVVAEEILEHIR